jgi:hypothetical protein
MRMMEPSPLSKVMKEEEEQTVVRSMFVPLFCMLLKK